LTTAAVCAPRGAGANDALVVAAPLGVEACALRRGDPRLRVLRTGMGRARARRAASRLRSDPARAFAVAGLCGSLVPELVPGDVVVASQLACDDAEEIELESAALCEALRALGFAPRVGRLYSVARLILGYDRERLVACGAVAVDMESAWLARGAGARPLAVLRVVSDGPGHELMRPAIVRQGVHALRRLRDAAPALERWGERVALPAQEH
jgi:4-hydroxy-3-methylbut-2-enyl diphosphate reductase